MSSMSIIISAYLFGSRMVYYLYALNVYNLFIIAESHVDVKSYYFIQIKKLIPSICDIELVQGTAVCNCIVLHSSSATCNYTGKYILLDCSK